MTEHKEKQTPRPHKTLRLILPVIFWLLIWQLAAVIINNDVLLAGPLETLSALIRLAGTSEFWQSAGVSYVKILLGFLLGAMGGAALAVLSFCFRLLGDFIKPIIGFCKSVPVACFVVIVLLYVGGGGISVVISAIVVIPVIYTGVASGLACADKDQLELARGYGMTRGDKVKHIYLPALYESFIGAVRLGAGMSFKAGIAAEVIAQSMGSLGNLLYRAKVLLQTDELFAVTVIVVALSYFTECVLVFLLRKWGKANDYE